MHLAFLDIFKAVIIDLVKEIVVETEGLCS